MQKRCRIVTRDFNHPQVGQRRNNGPGGRSHKFGRLVTEGFKDCRVRDSLRGKQAFGRFEKTAPVRVHGGSIKVWAIISSAWQYVSGCLRFCRSCSVRSFLTFVAAVTLAVAMALAGGWWWARQPIGLVVSPVDFRIKPGSSLRSAITQMRDAGIDVQPQLLEWLARTDGQESGIKAGSYSVEQGVTPVALLDKLIRGKFSQGEIALIEGRTLREWRSRIDRHADLRHDTAPLDDSALATRLGVPQGSLEGLLLADTYIFDKQSDDLELYARSLRAMQHLLDAEWPRRASGLPYRSPYEALTMASIVEKESGRQDDRGKIASVFVNRLRRGMPLQTDPTVIYGLGERFDGNLRKRDLQADTPYNTYTRPGLPPTPIAMPSPAALRAALHPDETGYLYFVARGDGSSEFSRTLEEHNRAVHRYQRGVN